MRRFLRPWQFAALALLPLVGACGVGGIVETSFVYGAMGPEGGTVEVEDVTLEIVPGAITEPTAVAVVPQDADLPITPPLGDPCTYTFLGPRWCVGPVGLDLALACVVTVRYDEGEIPPGVDEDDLVLLVWDVGLASYVLAAQDVIHDLTENEFVDAEVETLGHLALGIRTCPPSDVIALTAPITTPKPAPGAGTQQAVPGFGLYTTDVDDHVALTPVVTDVNMLGFVPSADGATVLYRTATVAQGFDIWTVGVDGTGPTSLASHDDDSDPAGVTFGWMRDDARAFFPQRVVASPPDPTVKWFSVVARTGATPPAQFYEVGDYSLIEDVRQSPDGTMVLIRKVTAAELQEVDVFDAVTGAAVSQGVIPVGIGQLTPRWLPDSSGVYVARADGTGVDRYDPDGTGPTTLFTQAAEEGLLKDFVLGPDGDAFAYVAYNAATVTTGPTTVAAPGNDGLYVGTLTGGMTAENDLGGAYFFDEMIFHPNGQSVFLDSSVDDVWMFNSADAVQGPTLPARGLSDVDIHSATGRLLIVHRLFSIIDGGESIDVLQTLPEGIFVAAPDGTSLTHVPMTGHDIFAARWTLTFRTTPGMVRSNRVR